mmetsp:Transcript_4540/g.5387  ORF Transcript_4540/g.5387 Transcript_4540/m.5387 type:complete len:531 (+) Transcript_4540:713-2305(+)
MAIQLTEEQITYTTNTLSNNTPSDRYISIEEVSNAGEGSSSLEATSPHQESSHEYELNQSESLSFLYNLLYDENSALKKSEILSILNSLKLREDNLPFSIQNLTETDCQGVAWPSGLREKISIDRARIGNINWFYNIPKSREAIKDHFNFQTYKTKTNFFQFHKFFCKLKLHITHFQLRNLVCCSENLSNGIFYPLSHLYDYNFPIDATSTDECQTFFRVNRLMPDDQLTRERHGMKLECLLESKSLLYNSNSRISTMTCSNNILACGTFEGGYILQDISSSINSELIGEYNLTNDSEGITNHIAIHDDRELIISSNDKVLRIIDITTGSIQPFNLPFSINCLSINPYNPNEFIISGDHINSFILDKRMPSIHNSQECKGHKDYGFSCDWSPKNENILVTGNQDSSIKIWDRRNTKESAYCWNSALGTISSQGGPIRNCKFSCNGEYLSWAESLDHVGIIQMDDLSKSDNHMLRVQSIDFLGKCTGLNFAPMEFGYGEDLIIGVNDCPLGGILNYKLESKCKSLDFDFYF